MELLRTSGRPPFRSAHRGHSTAAPENTLAALVSAWRTGATVAEIDVRMTSDGELVLMHDRMLDRTTTGRGLVSAHTLAELDALDAGSWFGAAFAGERIPHFADVLDWSRGRIGLLVELKIFPERDPRYVPKVVETVRALDAAGHAVIASFDHRVLKDIHAIEPDWQIEMILNGRLADPLAAARACSANLVSFEPEFCLAVDVAELHAGDVAALTTALSIEHALHLAEIGVDFIEADDAGFLQSAVARIQSGTAEPA